MTSLQSGLFQLFVVMSAQKKSTPDLGNLQLAVFLDFLIGKLQKSDRGYELFLVVSDLDF